MTLRRGQHKHLRIHKANAFSQSAGELRNVTAAAEHDGRTAVRDVVGLATPHRARGSTSAVLSTGSPAPGVPAAAVMLASSAAMSAPKSAVTVGLDASPPCGEAKLQVT